MNVQNNNNPPLLLIKKEKLREHFEKLLLPNSKELPWPVLKSEFDFLEFNDSNLFVLYKNEKPVGQYIETVFNDTITLSHFVVCKDERHKGYGNLLLEEFYNTHKNRRIISTAVPDLINCYEKKLSLKPTKKSFNCSLEFNKKNIGLCKENSSVSAVKFSQENFGRINDFISNNFGYHRNKATEFFLKKGMVYEYRGIDEEVEGVLCATKDHDMVRVESLIAEDFNIAMELFSCFLKSLPEENLSLFMSIPENDRFKDMIKAFGLNFDESNYVWILDSNLNCNYDNFYCISNATI